MANLDLIDEISAFDAQRPRLLSEHGAKWVVFTGRQFKGAFPTFEEAAEFALTTFPNADFLIRHTEGIEPQIPFVVVGE